MGPWMDGCVPDSMRYVPGRRGFVAVPKVSAVAVAAPARTSVENDWTRVPCAGGVFAAPGLAMGHLTCWAREWSGLVVAVAVVPSPPPNCPTITREVGTEFAPNVRLFVRLICRICPVGTVITTGDQVEGTIAAVDTDAGFNAAQVATGATLVAAAVPQ